MRAAVIRTFGAPDVLNIEDIPTPELPAGHVRVRVLAAGINRLDHYVRNGDYLSEHELSSPHVLGADASGEIDAVADDVTGFKVGDRVIPMPGYPGDRGDDDVAPITTAGSFGVGGVTRPGTYAQYLVVPAKWVVKDDTGLSPEEVATLPMVLTTAVRAVKVVGEVTAGQTVLVQAGASGTGSMAVQVAKALGARVLATTRRREKAEFIASIGADRVIVTSDEDFLEVVRQETDGAGVDVVLDGLGGEPLTRGVEALKSGGILVAFGFVAGSEAHFDVIPFFFANKQVRGTLMGDIEDLSWGLAQLKAGRIRPLLDSAYPLGQAAAAHQRVADSQALGNVVLLPWA